MTQASGLLAIEFDHYKEVPASMQDKTIKEDK